MAKLLEQRADMNKLRNIINNAQDKRVISKEEAGFIVLLANRFRDDIERKTRAMLALQGEISQLRANEQIIMDIVKNLVAAQERADAREKTVQEIRKAKEEAQKRKAKEAMEEEKADAEAVAEAEIKAEKAKPQS